jgi:hypothetical protein
LSESRVVHAGEHGDAEQARPMLLIARSFPRGAHHRHATGGVQGDQFDVVELGGRGYAVRDGVWDVVEFQVEEDPKTKARKPMNDSRAFGCKQLIPNFAKSDVTAKVLCEVDGVFLPVHIQRDD